MSYFLIAKLLADCLVIRFHVVVEWEYESIFNTKYLIINSNRTACSRNRLAVLIYIYIQTHTHK